MNALERNYVESESVGWNVIGRREHLKDKKEYEWHAEIQPFLPVGQ